LTLRKKLVQLDVDSTFIQQEAIELLAAHAGVLTEVSQITESAMRGELDFAASLRARVLLLKGLSADVIEAVQKEISLTDGAQELVENLHAKGSQVALVSGGFIDIIEPMINRLSIDYFKANKLEIIDGVLTGHVTGKIIDRKAKADALFEFSNLAGVTLDDCVAIGDGANDLDMMAIAGLSIAFNAKPIVAQAAHVAINEPSLRSVMTLIESLSS
jgi:phosphoserine phosphatase